MDPFLFSLPIPLYLMHFINLSLFILSFLCNYIFATTDLFDTVLEVPTKCKNGIRHRIEWRLFPEQGRRKYLEAILKLQSRSDDAPSDYDRMAQIHGDNAKQLHSGSSFLPWHRVFIYKFEIMIQTVMKDPKFAIPFWAWQLDASVFPSFKVVNPSNLDSSHLRPLE